MSYHIFCSGYREHIETMTSPASKSKTKSPKSPGAGLLSKLNCASGKSGKSPSTVPLTMAPATPPDLSQSYAEDPGQLVCILICNFITDEGYNWVQM